MNHTIPVAVGKMGDKLVETFQDIPAQLHELRDVTRHKARDAMHTTDKAVHRHPYRAIGFAAAVSLIIGLLVSRR